MCGYCENLAKILNSYQECWIISPFGSWSLVGHRLSWPHAAFWLFETELTRFLECWSFRLCVLDSTARPRILGLTARFNILGLTDQLPWSLPPPTSAGSRGVSTLCCLRAKIDKKDFPENLTLLKDAEDKIISLATHSRTHTETHTHTSLYIYIYIYIYISSSSCRVASTDIPDPLSLLFPIVHRLWQVFWTTSCILT